MRKKCCGVKVLWHHHNIHPENLAFMYLFKQTQTKKTSLKNSFSAVSTEIDKLNCINKCTNSGLLANN